MRVLLRSGFRLSGTIVFEGGAPPMPPQRFAPFLEGTDSWLDRVLPEVTVFADGSFMSYEAPLGRYRLTIPTPTGWLVKTAMVGDRDLSELPFDLTEDLRNIVVTLTSRGSGVSGVVRNTTSSPDAAATVIVFSTDSRQWVDFSAYPRRIRDVRTKRDGTYSVSDLPAGEYFVVARPSATVDWSVTGFFESLNRAAARITLAEGEQRALDLRTAVVK